MASHDRSPGTVAVRPGLVLLHLVGPLLCTATYVTLGSFNVKPLALHFMVEQRKKTATLNLRIDPDLKAAAERYAADDRRSLTSLVEKVLAEHLKAIGYLK